jgi:hypothetical protein
VGIAKMADSANQSIKTGDVMTYTIAAKFNDPKTHAMENPLVSAGCPTVFIKDKLFLPPNGPANNSEASQPILEDHPWQRHSPIYVQTGYGAQQPTVIGQNAVQFLQRRLWSFYRVLHGTEAQNVIEALVSEWQSPEISLNKIQRRISGPPDFQTRIIIVHPSGLKATLVKELYPLGYTTTRL